MSPPIRVRDGMNYRYWFTYRINIRCDFYSITADSRISVRAAL